MSVKSRLVLRNAYQAQDHVYLQYEFQWPSLRKRLARVELAEVASIMTDGGALSAFETLPSGSCKLKGSIFEISPPTSESDRLMKVNMEFVLPRDKMFHFLQFQLVEHRENRNQHEFRFSITNKMNWLVNLLKIETTIASNRKPDQISLCRLSLETNQEKKLDYQMSAFNRIAWMDAYKPLEAKAYVLRLFFKKDSRSKANIDVIVGDSSLTNAQTVTFVNGHMLEALGQYRKLLGTLQGDVLWLEKQIDSNCFHYLKHTDQKKVKTIRILGGPLHVNQDFRMDFNAFKTDLQTAGVEVDCRVILDETTLQKLHDRYFFDDSQLFAHPPSQVISKQLGSVTPIQDPKARSAIRSFMEKIWKISTPISQWGKIQQKRKTIKPKPTLFGS